MNTWKSVSIAFMVIGGIGLLVSIDLVIHGLLRNFQYILTAYFVFGLVSAASSAAIFLLGFMSGRSKQEQILQS